MTALRCVAVLLAAVALVYAAPAAKRPPPEMSVTLDDGRAVVLKPDSTYAFRDGYVIPEDSAAISTLLGDGRTVRLLPDGTWQIGRNLPPYAPRTVAVSFEAFTVSSTQDKGTAGKSEAAAREQITTKAVDKIAKGINHPLVKRAMVLECFKTAIPQESVVMRAGAKTAVSAELNLQPSDLKKIKECLDVKITEEPAADTAAAAKTPAKK